MIIDDESKAFETEGPYHEFGTDAVLATQSAIAVGVEEVEGLELWLKLLLPIPGDYVP